MEEKNHFPPESDSKPADLSVSKPANLATEVFGFQRFFLQIFGFAPSRFWRLTFFRAMMWFVSAVVFTASIAELFYQISVLIKEIKESSEKAEKNLVLTVLSHSPYIAESMRGVLVLTILILNRKSWQHLAHFADEIVNQTFPDDEKRKSKMKKWKIFAFFFGFGTILLHLGWETAALFGDYGSVFWSEIFPDAASPRDNASTSIMTKETLWFYCLSSVAESIPFILSQQIFAIIIVLAFVLKSGAKILNHRITDLREETEIKVSEEAARRVEVLGWDKPKFALEEEIRQVNSKAAALQEFHLRLILFNQEINHVFGWIIFILYSMDVVTLVGFVALLVTNDNPTVAIQALHSTSILLFGCFATIFYIPMVQAHEEAAEVTFGLRRLIGVTAKLEARENALQKRLEVFCTASRRHVIMFEGAELLHVTRMFIVTTCTMTVSIAVLAYEVLNKGTI